MADYLKFMFRSCRQDIQKFLFKVTTPGNFYARHARLMSE